MKGVRMCTGYRMEVFGWSTDRCIRLNRKILKHRRYAIHGFAELSYSIKASYYRRIE